MKNIALLLTIALIASSGFLWWVCRPPNEAIYTKPWGTVWREQMEARERNEKALDDVNEPNGFWLGNVYLANDFEVISDQEDLRRKVVPLIREEIEKMAEEGYLVLIEKETQQ